ncbi:MAG TPA: hypothetical protein VJ023_05450 [Pyrinomonadaceae bacterium]|nr:hypothetical protein [Pyrinomonadaceae bacterium]
MPDESIGGPYVAVACLCEQVIEDKRGRFSFINLIDRLTIATRDQASPEQMPAITLRAKAVLIFKSGFFRGPATVKLALRSPTEQIAGQSVFPVLFEGDDRGVAIVTNLNAILQEEGLYWADVYLQDQIVTRIPLRTIYQRVVTG